MQNGQTVSVATTGDRVADIRPLGRIQTVQVEVEPNPAEEEEPEEPDSAEKENASPTEKAPDLAEERKIDGEGEGTVESPSSRLPPPPQTPSPTSQPSEEALPSTHQSPATTKASLAEEAPPPTSSLASVPLTTGEGTPPASLPSHAAVHSQHGTSPAQQRGASAVGRISPQALPTVAEGLQEAEKKAASAKKPKKVKALSTKDLLPLHQDVGRSTKQLVEPATPEFKPTAEWVKPCDVIIKAWGHG